MSNRYKEITKLINAGYPILYGIAFLILAVFLIFKAATIALNEGTISMLGLTALTLLILVIPGGMGILLIKMGIEAKRNKNY